jgi:hypothetical protein
MHSFVMKLFFTESYRNKLTNRSFPTISKKKKKIYLRIFCFHNLQSGPDPLPSKADTCTRLSYISKHLRPTTSYSICPLHYFLYSSHAIIFKHFLLLRQCATVIFISRSNKFVSHCSFVRYRLNLFICDYINTNRTIIWKGKSLLKRHSPLLSGSARTEGTR